MKRLLFILAITMATVSSIQAAHVSENAARKVADRFFTSKVHRAPAQGGQLSTPRLAYTAQGERFYVFEQAGYGGFVVVAGDDRLPEVLGYAERGNFSAMQLPPALQYWMHEMNRQIAFLQEHDDVAVLAPIRHETAVEPLMTTTWDQGAPYNDMCPTYSDQNGGEIRCVTGCVATAFAQVMNYHQWPDVGTGSHSYICNVNDKTETELSADFSQSVYQWDLMLDNYDEESSAESCAAVAKLMSDVGISMDMGYGSSSGASEMTAMRAMIRYFKYNEHSYLANRDNFTAEEWDKMLVDEISARRPIVYCGYDLTGQDSGGHAFVFDGFNTDGYFHVNWGWGGSGDGYFLFTLLAPSSSLNFDFGQDGVFGLVPITQADDVEEVLYVHSNLVPITTSTELGNRVSVKTEDFTIQGNMYSGYEERNGNKDYYINMLLSLGVFDSNGVERKHERFSQREFLNNYYHSSGRSVTFDLPNSLEDGEYSIRLSYSLDEGVNYDLPVNNYNGKAAYIKMVVREGKAYLYDCLLSNRYTLDAFDITSGTTINQPISVDAKLSYRTWSPDNGPVGNVYLALLKDGQEEVTTSELYEVQLASNTPTTYHMQIMAPAEMGLYDLAIKDEDGNVLVKTVEGWAINLDEAIEPIYILPICQQLTEDFESMTANSSTSDKNVQGNFATWSFNKSGVRAPGEDRCHGTNSVMMKKPSTLFTTQPLSHNFFMAQAVFFNTVSTASKFTLEYSTDGGATWQKANTIDNNNAAEVPEKSTHIVRWLLDLKASQPATFRIAMTGGGTASNYMDDFVLYYNDALLGDVNTDGAVNIADVNAVIHLILTGGTSATADVNGDGVINITDINLIIAQILK